MLTLNKNIDQKVNIDIVNQEAASDTKFYYDKLLTNFGLTGINKPFDTELYEYRPVSNNINYFIYFLSFKDKNFNDDVIKNIEPGFNDYYTLAESTLKTVHKGNAFDFLQNNGNLNMVAPKDMFKTATQIALDKPYQITDIVQEVNKLTPIKAGLPLFYDTFTFPFSEKIKTWNDRPNKFSDLPALYNSFLLLDFYSSPNRSIQQKMLSLPIFVVDRYMMYEKSVNEVKQLRPTFLLQNGIEGYSIFFLQNFGINKLYVRYSFWNAMNGARIPLLASSVHTQKKKGIQSVSNFDHRNEYIMIDFNFDQHTYKMYEFNDVTKQYDIQAYDFDLYELFYDDYWAGKLVKNTRPIPLQEPSTYVVNFNQTIDLTINHTRINVEDRLYMTEIQQNVIDEYYRKRYNDGVLMYMKDYTKFVFPTLKTTKNILPISRKTLFVDQNNNESISNCYEKTIDTITITNNNNNNIIIYDVFIGDINIQHTPMYQSDDVGEIKKRNYMLVDNIYNKKLSKTYNEQKLLVENYITYKDLGVINQNDLIRELYTDYYEKFSSTYNINEANQHNVIENLDFDNTNPKSLVTYLRNNYILSKSGQNRYSSSITGKGSANGTELYSDGLSGYYQILRDYKISDPNITKMTFKNMNYEDRNKFLDNIIYLNRLTYNVKLSKDIAYELNPLSKFTISQIEQDILPNLKDNNTAIKSIDYKFTPKYGGDGDVWLRDCMSGLNISYKTDNSTLGLNEKIELNVNFFIGEQFAIHALNPNYSLTLSATIKIILADRFSNRKTYTIPVSYELQLI